MATTYDVRIWSNDVYKGARTTSYIVRWRVGERRFKERYKTQALADSFRSELVTAARKGEAFDVDTGRPVSMGRTNREMAWYDFACAYMGHEVGAVGGDLPAQPLGGTDGYCACALRHTAGQAR